MHEETLAPKTKRLLIKLENIRWLKDFYLAGGTALALQYGHRQSIDLDWFSEYSIQTKLLMKKISTQGMFQLLNEEENTIEGLLDGVKVSFMTYPYPLLLKKIRYRPTIDLASALDIATMKMGAIAGRNTKKDFIDLYVFLQKESLTLRALFKQLTRKYKNTDIDCYHLYRALTYFTEADQEPMPKMLQVVDWKEVKTFFLHEVKALT